MAKKNNSIASDTAASILEKLQKSGFKSISHDVSELEEADKSEVVTLLNTEDTTAYIENNGVNLIVENNEKKNKN